MKGAFCFIPSRKQPFQRAVSLLGTCLSFCVPEPVQDLQMFNNSKNERIKATEQGESPFPAKEDLSIPHCCSCTHHPLKQLMDKSGVFLWHFCGWSLFPSLSEQWIFPTSNLVPGCPTAHDAGAHCRTNKLSYRRIFTTADQTLDFLGKLLKTIRSGRWPPIVLSEIDTGPRMRKYCV